jgi:hypothetical protein
MRLLVYIPQVLTFIGERRAAFVMMADRNGEGFC